MTRRDPVVQALLEKAERDVITDGRQSDGMSDVNIGSDYSAEQTRWLKACDGLSRAYRRHGTPRPPDNALFRLALAEGYRRVAPPRPVPKYQGK
jgi:hypothetical protein